MYRRARAMYLAVPPIRAKALNYALFGATPSWRVASSRHAFGFSSNGKVTRGAVMDNIGTKSAIKNLHSWTVRETIEGCK